MKRNRHITAKAGQSLTTVIVVGILVASLLSILLTALVTNLVLNGSFGENSVAPIIFVIRTISLFIGALIGGALSKHKILLQVSLTALGYMIVLLGIGIVFYDGSFKHFLSGAVSVLAGGVAALLILQRPKNKSRRRTKISL